MNTDVTNRDPWRVTFHGVTQDGTINPRVAEQPSQTGPSYNAARPRSRFGEARPEQPASEMIDMKASLRMTAVPTKETSSR